MCKGETGRRNEKETERGGAGGGGRERHTQTEEETNMQRWGQTERLTQKCSESTY